ncbi:hypothetical protein N0M98_08735 [Paenibacillus doosanensis]|uniref:Uncharacterized protein n=1 Tax=Paenibacillus konkukensis TaxID=2020716 RepID=A0ABY4RXT2_9BACL|nr:MULTISPECIES: hypothetical protein [Paenibacillus]MCS7460226.1 hypothetical protein [Paenibacillus doosanensis]UQZ86227.1 hypothetical protein SK3146_05520 [Paenibacillus konkukensis]
MAFVDHMNYANAAGNVYCCLRNKVVSLDDAQLKTYCQGCKMFRGAEPGKSVQCYWNDSRDVSDPHIVYEPQLEFKSMQKRKLRISPPADAAESETA